MILRAERIDAVRVWLRGQPEQMSARVASQWVQQWFNCRVTVADALVAAARRQDAAQTPQGSHFDYERQAWTVDGRYVACGHAAPCGCYGRAHAGEPAPLAHLPTARLERLPLARRPR